MTFDPINNVVTKFLDGFLCSQAVLSTYAPLYGLDTDIALKIAAGFGGGMGRQGETCGALTGSVMVIGLQKGAVNHEDLTARAATYAAVKELFERFRNENGSTICRELLNNDIRNPEEYERAKKENLFRTRCPGYVKSAVSILSDILQERI